MDYIDTEQKQNKASQPTAGNASAASRPENTVRENAFLLQELAVTDLVLKKIPTHRVVNAYEQMLRIAPELAKEKEPLRGFLRQAAAKDVVDPFQGKSLIQTNMQLLKQHQLQNSASMPYEKQP